MRLPRLLIASLLLCLALLARPSPAADGAASQQPPPRRRVALVVGNGAYRAAPELPNPPNDAREVAASLRGLGFDVVERATSTTAASARPWPSSPAAWTGPRRRCSSTPGTGSR
jgi:hypothetical protein